MPASSCRPPPRGRLARPAPAAKCPLGRRLRAAGSAVAMGQLRQHRQHRRDGVSAAPAPRPHSARPALTAPRLERRPRARAAQPRGPSRWNRACGAPIADPGWRALWWRGQTRSPSCFPTPTRAPQARRDAWAISLPVRLPKVSRCRRTS